MAVLLKLWSTARHWSAEVWLPGHELMPEILILCHKFRIISEYGTAFILSLGLEY